MCNKKEENFENKKKYKASLNYLLNMSLNNLIYIPNVEKSFNTGAGKYSLLIAL